MDLNRFIQTCSANKDAATGLAFFTIFALGILLWGIYWIVKAAREPKEIHYHYENDDSE